jgi:hypothetical protein
MTPCAANCFYSDCTFIKTAINVFYFTPRPGEVKNKNKNVYPW